MLAADNWCLKVHDKVYGPYTSDQLATFIDEGRVNQNSLLAPAGGTSWKHITHYPNFSPLFPQEQKPIRAQFGRNAATDTAAGAEAENAHFVIIFDTVSGAATRLERFIRQIGPATRLMDNTWFLSSPETLTGIKNALLPHLNAREPIFIIDTTRGKVDWQNFTPGIHSKLVKTWNTRFKASPGKT